MINDVELSMLCKVFDARIDNEQVRDEIVTVWLDTQARMRSNLNWHDFHENGPKVPHNDVAYLVTTNSDRTEGKGHPIHTHVCKVKATALRFAKGLGVQGSDAAVTRVPLFITDGYTYGPVNIIQPNTEDRLVQGQLDKEDERKRLHDEAVKRAEKLGLSKEDIAILKGD